MNWTDLPTNYQDAVWEGNRKFQMINNADGTVSFIDRTQYSQIDNSYRSAADVNATNRAINMIVHAFEARYRLDIPINVSVEKSGNNVAIKWQDPPNITDSTGNIITQWAGTKVIRKIIGNQGSVPPIDESDGVLIVNEVTRNQYKTTALIDSSVEEGRSYYYGIFPYTTDGNYTISTVVMYIADS